MGLKGPGRQAASSRWTRQIIFSLQRQIKGEKEPRSEPGRAGGTEMRQNRGWWQTLDWDEEPDEGAIRAFNTSSAFESQLRCSRWLRSSSRAPPTARCSGRVAVVPSWQVSVVFSLPFIYGNGHKKKKKNRKTFDICGNCAYLQTDTFTHGDVKHRQSSSIVVFFISLEKPNNAYVQKITGTTMFVFFVLD